MKCPNCNNDKLKYNLQRNKHIRTHDKRNSAKKRKSKAGTQHKKEKPREDFNASCTTCNWKGIMYDEVLDKPQVLPENIKEKW